MTTDIFDRDPDPDSKGTQKQIGFVFVGLGGLRSSPGVGGVAYKFPAPWKTSRLQNNGGLQA